MGRIHDLERAGLGGRVISVSLCTRQYRRRCPGTNVAGTDRIRSPRALGHAPPATITRANKLTRVGTLHIRGMRTSFRPFASKFPLARFRAANRSPLAGSSNRAKQGEVGGPRCENNLDKSGPVSGRLARDRACRRDDASGCGLDQVERDPSAGNPLLSRVERSSWLIDRLASNDSAL